MVPKEDVYDEGKCYHIFYDVNGITCGEFVSDCCLNRVEKYLDSLESERFATCA